MTLAPGIDVNPAPDPLNADPVMLPLALIKPVTYSPEVAHTTTLLVPPILTVALPPDVAILTFEVPLLILLTETAPALMLLI